MKSVSDWLLIFVGKEDFMKSITLVACNAKYCHTSLAVRSIRAACAERGIPAILLEHSVNEPFRQIMQSILSCESDIYAFSCYLWNMELVKKICLDLKTVKPGCKILLGGPEVSFDPESYTFADAVICGEGEAAVPEYVLEQCEEKTIYGTPVESLDALPFCYSEADLRANRHRLLYYESSRGCPYACSYCLSSIEKGVRFKSIEKVCRELKKFDDAKVDLVKFVDRTFNADGERALAIWKYAAEECHHTRFHFELAGELLREKELAYLQTVPKGKFQFEIGIQSTFSETLRAVCRDADTGVLFEKIKRLVQMGNIHVHTDLIAGLPYESYAVFKNSFNDTYALMTDCLQLGFLKLLKGSKIREEAERFQYRFSAAPPYTVYENAFISAEEIFRLEKIAEAVERFYNSHAFEKSMAYAVSLFPSPFDFYEALSKRFDGINAVAQKKLYEILYAFCTEHFGVDVLLTEYLKFDWIRQTKGIKLPACLGSMETLQPVLFQLLEKEGFKEKYLPALTGIKNKEIIKHVFIRKFTLPEERVYLFHKDSVTDITAELEAACN